MIEIKGITKKYHKHVVLDEIDLTVHDGEVVAIIGPSGAGKSTLLRCLNLLEKPDSGVIKLDDIVIDTTAIKKKDVLELRKNTAMVFQSFNLFKQKTALENVMEGLTIVKKMEKEEAKKLASLNLDKVGLADRADYFPKELSGGQQQRVAIARALSMNPKILLLDEPTSALDPELVGEVLSVIKAAAKAGNTMILVSHELSFVRDVASRVLFLEGGKIIEDGTPSEVFNYPKNERTKQFLSRFYNTVEYNI